MFLDSFKGLNLQTNSFKDLEGYMEVAENVVLSRENILQKRNGYKTFLDTAVSVPLALADYKNKIILIGSDYVSVLNQNASGDYSSTSDLSGQTFTVSYPRNMQAAGNLFVTTDNYLLKLESSSAPLLQAGVPKAPDLTYLPLGSGTVSDAIAGIHVPDTQIGYRVIYGRKDLNSNLVLGAPSELTINTNPLIDSTAVALSTYDVTVTSVAHGLLVDDFVTIKNSNGTTPVPDGEYTVTTVADADNFTISTIAVLTSPPVAVTSLKFGIRRKPKLEFTIPSQINTTYIYRVYRSNGSISNDVEPDESTLQLINEQNVSSAEVTAGYIQFTDTIDDLFKTTFLYTNPNTGEGINEANYQPPVSLDIALFKNHSFLSYPTTFYSLQLSLIRSAAATFVNGDYFDVIQVDKIRASTAAEWQSGTTVRYTMADVTNTQTGQYVSFVGFINSANNGKFIITAVGANYVECTNSGRTDATLDETSVTTASMYPVRRYTAASSVSYNTPAGGSFLLTTSSASISSNIDATSRSICKTINRDTYSNCYCSYTSSSQSLPGQMFIYSRIITDNFALQASRIVIDAIVHAGTSGGFSISTDGGVTFTNKTTTDGLGANGVLGVYVDGTTIYAGTTGGLSISTNGGTSFTNKTTTAGLGSNVVYSIYADGTTVYAATSGGFSISTDGGTTFTNKTTTDGLGNNTVRYLYIDGSTIYAGTNGGLSISTNGGTSFINKTTTDGLGNNIVLGVYVVGSTVYAATNGGGLSISTNGGTSFTTKTTADGLGSNIINCIYVVGSTVYAGTGGGLSISTNGGTSFTNKTTTSGLGNDSVRSIYADGLTIYAGTAAGFSISTNGGTSFTNKTTAAGLGSNTILSAFTIDSSETNISNNFDPILPTANTDLSVIGENQVLPNGLYISKPNEFEAFPLLSFILIGSKDAAIQRIFPLKNSLIIFKEDGIFSLRGDTRSDFTVVPLDTSIYCNAIESIVEINGNLYAMTLSGVVQVSETNVAIVSRNIEPLLTAVFTDTDFSNNTYATTIEGARTYAVTTITPNDGDATTYIYDVIENKWTTSTKLYKQGIIKRSDNTHYAISTDDKIIKMRRSSNKLDYCDEDAVVSSVTNISSDFLSCFIVSPLTIEDGDVLVWDDTINRIDKVLVDGTLTFRTVINFTEADLPTHYKRIVSNVTFSPMGGQEDTLSQFQEMSMNFRNQSCSTIDIGFISDAGEVPVAAWNSEILLGGWGDLPWGQFEWGLTETTAIDLKTYSAQPVRVFVPVECQISTWIQVKLSHYQAAQQISLQGLGLMTRTISNRISI